MKNKRRVYISGKITGLSRNEYLKRFQDTQDKLEMLGYEVVNPAKLCDTLPISFEWKEYMNVCVPLVKKCDAILMLKGYEDSKGALVELSVAQKNSLEIIYEGELNMDVEKQIERQYIEFYSSSDPYNENLRKVKIHLGGNWIVGKFHEWGMEYKEDVDKQFSVAIVELENGNIVTINPNYIQFI